MFFRFIHSANINNPTASSNYRGISNQTEFVLLNLLLLVFRYLEAFTVPFSLNTSLETN